jgi:hypothetical protein
MKKKVSVSNKAGAMDGETMYRRLLLINEKKKVSFHRVMSFEIA